MRSGRTLAIHGAVCARCLSLPYSETRPKQSFGQHLPVVGAILSNSIPRRLRYPNASLALDHTLDPDLLVQNIINNV